MTKELYEYMIEKGIKMKYVDNEPFPIYPYFGIEFIEGFQRFIENNSK